MSKKDALFALVVSAATLLASSCKKPDDKPAAPAESAAASPNASAAPAQPATSAAKPKWHVGSWSGTYTTRKHEIVMTAAEGALKEWKEEPGTAGSGEGKLQFTVDEAGTIAGTATGALGDMVVTGRIEEDALTLHLKPSGSEVSNFNGFAALNSARGNYKGTLRAASGDGTAVRAGTIEAAPAKAP